MVNSIINYFRKNPTTPTIKKVYQNPESSVVDLIFKRYKGYHGTLLERVGDEQIQSGKFDQRERRIYLADFETAKRYAEKRCTGQKTPVIVKISSETKPLWNEITLDGHGFTGLGAYEYFPANAQVRIEAVYMVEDNQTQNPKE